MPQFDFFTFSVQNFWTLFSFFIFYFFTLYFYLGYTSEILKSRNKLLHVHGLENIHIFVLNFSNFFFTKSFNK
jgi:hypothetical protein